MKTIALIAVTLLAVASCDNAYDQDSTKDVEAIKALSASRAKAFNEQNAGVIANAFSENGVLMAPGTKSTTGREAVRRYYQGIFDQYETFLESGYEEVRVTGNLAYGVGFAKVRLVPRGSSDTLISSAKYVNLLRRQDDGTWLTTHDIWNGNEP